VKFTVCASDDPNHGTGALKRRESVWKLSPQNASNGAIWLVWESINYFRRKFLLRYRWPYLFWLWDTHNSKTSNAFVIALSVSSTAVSERSGKQA
jgi:hypothetical protein